MCVWLSSFPQTGPGKVHPILERFIPWHDKAAVGASSWRLCIIPALPHPQFLPSQDKSWRRRMLTQG